MTDCNTVTNQLTIGPIRLFDSNNSGYLDPEDSVRKDNYFYYRDANGKQREIRISYYDARGHKHFTKEYLNLKITPEMNQQNNEIVFADLKAHGFSIPTDPQAVPFSYRACYEHPMTIQYYKSELQKHLKFQNKGTGDLDAIAFESAVGRLYELYDPSSPTGSQTLSALQLGLKGFLNRLTDEERKNSIQAGGALYVYLEKLYKRNDLNKITKDGFNPQMLARFEKNIPELLLKTLIIGIAIEGGNFEESDKKDFRNLMNAIYFWFQFFTIIKEQRNT